MKQAKPILHARDHEPGGADPIHVLSTIASDGIRFNFDNQGGWLDITTNDVDGNGLGMSFVDNTDGGFQFITFNGAMTINTGASYELTDDSSFGISMTETGSGGITTTNVGSGDVVVESTGTGDTIIRNVHSGGSGLLQLKNDNGATAPQIINLYAPGTSAFGIQIIPNPGDPVQIGYVPNGGNPNPGDVTLIGANIEMFAYTTEPSSSMISSQIGGKLYFYDPTGTGTAGNLHLKVIFDNGTKVTLATA